MAFVTGVLVVEAPASALNNHGKNPEAQTDNAVAVKQIRTPEGIYPYVSAQAVRFWLRTALEHGGTWQAAPVFREGKVAYTDGNPIKYWDDDLFGYMRAPSKKKDAMKDAKATPLEKDREVTRVAPFRVGTLVATAPTRIVDDFGVMARSDGDPVPHEHQFYRALLKAPFSIDLACAGTFFDGERVGFKNLDTHRRELADSEGLPAVTVRGQSARRLPTEQRAERVAALLRGLGELQGGAKLTTHLTDTNPAITILTITRGGNHPFQRVISGTHRGATTFHREAFEEALRVNEADLLSPVYFGWARGLLDDERARLEAFLGERGKARPEVQLMHPREAFAAIAGQVIERAADLMV